MQIEPNLTNGLNVTLEANENNQTMPEVLNYMLSEGIEKGHVKIKKVVIEYVTEDDEHYLVTQYA